MGRIERVSSIVGAACESIADEITGFQGFAGTDTDAYVGDNNRIMRIPIP